MSGSLRAWISCVIKEPTSRPPTTSSGFSILETREQSFVFSVKQIMGSMNGDYDSPWESLSAVINESLGVDYNKVDQGLSFTELGGSSLDMVATVIQLQESGFKVTIEDLLEPKSIATCIRDSENNFQQSENSNGFSIKTLAEVDQTEARQLLAESFYYKAELFTKFPGCMSFEDLLNLYEKWWDIFGDYSCVIVDRAGRLRAVGLAADDIDLKNVPLDGIPQHFLEIEEMLEKETGAFRKQLNPKCEKGVTLAKFMFGGSSENNPHENVAAFLMIEKEMIEVAKRNGYKHTIAENTSPLTQQLSEYLGCRRLSEWKVNEWKDIAGIRRFAVCSDSYTGTVDVFDIPTEVDSNSH